MLEPKDEIKQRLDIVDVISGYLTLKPAGSAAFKALCPFHSEKSPSFHISRERQIWHCFGCNKGGDMFAFVMEMEGMDFLEALRLLGGKAGVVIPEFTSQSGSNEEAAIRDIQELACKFFETMYWQHAEGQAAREYLHRRGIPDDLIRSFRLGAAPDRWDAVTVFLQKKGFSVARLEKAGLTKPRSNGQGMIDRFRNRVMIPLCDAQGRVVGFTARLLGEMTETSGPKYLNSPETLVYHKGDMLFGLHLAKTAIRTEQSVIIMEGNVDVIASHKAGVQNVVASSGTALTESQLRQLKRLTNRLVFCFDGDSAGFTAAKRGIHLAQEQGFEIRVIAIPKELGKDPDEVVQKDPSAWQKLAKEPIHIMDYYFRQALSKFHPERVEEKKELVHFIASEITRLPDVVEREHWLQMLSDVVRMDVVVLRPLVTKDEGIASSRTPRNDNKSSVIASEAKQSLVSTKLYANNSEQAAAHVVATFLTRPDLQDEIAKRLDASYLPEPWKTLYIQAILLYTAPQSADSTTKAYPLFSRLSDYYQAQQSLDMTTRIQACVLWIDRLHDGLLPEQVRDELNRHIGILSASEEKDVRARLEASIRQAEASGDKERLQTLLEEYARVLKST